MAEVIRTRDRSVFNCTLYGVVFSSINFLIRDKTIMPKYTQSFTVVKSFEAKVIFEAPNDDVAAEMASDMTQDDGDFIADRADEDSVAVDSVSLDGSHVCQLAGDPPVDRSVQRWCENWLNEREELV